MKHARREVALPSQEGKKGVMQYALYVECFQLSIWILVARDTHASEHRLMIVSGQHWIKSPIGRARARCGL